ELHMTAVFCAGRLHQLEAQRLSGLRESLSGLLADAAAAGEEPMVFRGFEVFRGNLLVARFKASGALSRLRRAAWQEFKQQGAAFPDALWPLGASRGARQDEGDARAGGQDGARRVPRPAGAAASCPATWPDAAGSAAAG
ncbi:unnamed protein product, partial [Prorocentrum cordatum]